MLIGVYKLYENWSTETFRKIQRSGLGERIVDDPRSSFYRLDIDGCVSKQKPLDFG